MDLHPEKHTDSGIISIISVVYDIYQGLFKRDRELDDAIDTAEQRLPPSLPSLLSRCPPKVILAGIDKAPRLSISIVIWILSSDTICQLN